jgi:hypothetical protein
VLIISGLKPPDIVMTGVYMRNVSIKRSAFENIHRNPSTTVRHQLRIKDSTPWHCKMSSYQYPPVAPERGEIPHTS